MKGPLPCCARLEISSNLVIIFRPARQGNIALLGKQTALTQLLL